MAERGKPALASTAKPMQMKLFATWEVDRTPSNCIPRYGLFISALVPAVTPSGAPVHR